MNNHALSYRTIRRLDLCPPRTKSWRRHWSRGAAWRHNDVIGCGGVGVGQCYQRCASDSSCCCSSSSSSSGSSCVWHQLTQQCADISRRNAVVRIPPSFFVQYLSFIFSNVENRLQRQNWRHWQFYQFLHFSREGWAAEGHDTVYFFHIAINCKFLTPHSFMAGRGIRALLTKRLWKCFPNLSISCTASVYMVHSLI